MIFLYNLTFHRYPSQALTYNPWKINLETHLEHLRDSSVRGGRGWWRVSADRTGVSLGFTHPFRANGVDYLMPILAVSKLHCGAPMNWGTLWVLASRENVVPNPNRKWSLKNEIGYFRPQHHYPVAFDSSLIALMSFELWTLEDRPWSTHREPWGLLSTGWLRTMDGLCG